MNINKTYCNSCNLDLLAEYSEESDMNNDKNNTNKNMYLEYNPSFEWLIVFDKDDLCQFIKELHNAYSTCITNHKSESVIHEWYESYLAIQSQEHKAAFED